jgi:hypothetical protein
LQTSRRINNRASAEIRTGVRVRRNQYEEVTRTQGNRMGPLQAQATSGDKLVKNAKKEMR